MGGVRYEEVEHTADWALRVRGATMGELCQVAASAMLAACGARSSDGPSSERSVRLEAADRETLLVQWLEEVLFALEGRSRIPVRIEVEVSPPLSLSATWEEVPLAGIEKPIKAVTFHELVVREDTEGLETTIVFDV
ncbi:MAG TPA: archease [Anaerolineales bacterium]|nr:archease [Anaerolineales bacterium]